MFQFRRFPTYAYLIQRRLTEYCSAGFPHSVIPGSKLMCSSPRLIAACHDLLRLLMPRHSPCALISLTSWRRIAPPSGSLKNHAVHRELSILAPLFLPVRVFHNFRFQIALCCLLFILESTLFSFQGANPLTIRSDRNVQALAQALRSDLTCSDLYDRFPFGKAIGGPKWTRTTDLTIISRVL